MIAIIVAYAAVLGIFVILKNDYSRE